MRYLLLLLPLLTVACGTKGKAFIGNWSDTGGGITTIAIQGNKAQVVRVVDSDGEVFEVRSSELKKKTIRWVYFVPSTSYLVTIDAQEPEHDTMQTHWFNDHDAAGADEVLTKK